MNESAASLGDGIHGYYACKRPEVQELVRTSAKRILDVGCASGVLGFELKTRNRAEVWGVEYVDSVAAVAADKLDRVLSGGIESALPQLPDNYFDVIICADVLEHLVDPWQVLVELRAKLADGGELVASIPNVRHWSVLAGLLQGDWTYEDAGILDRTHLRFFTWNSCLRMFADAGFVIVKAGATLLDGDDGFPAAAVKEMGKAGLDVSSLEEESRQYQYLVVASPKPQKQDLTSIVILTWNQLSFTQVCLASIAEHTPEPYELIVVDNGSTDGTVTWLRQQVQVDKRIKIIENSSNRGFAAGCNQGLKAATGEYLLLLNNDTVVTPGWLSGMRELLKRYPDAGIVGPMTNSASGVQVVSNVGYEALDQLSGWAGSFRQSYRYRVVHERRIVGFCMLFRRGLVDRIGFLDESFGTGNFEDDDYCLRSELAGFHNMIAGDVFIHHEGGATFSGNGINFSDAMKRNQALFKNKWDYNRLDEVTLRHLITLDVIREAGRMAIRGEVETAIEMLLQKGIRIAPDNPASYIALVDVLIDAGRYYDAIQVVSEFPPDTDPTIKHQIESECYAALGDDAKAKTAAEDAGYGQPKAIVVLGTLAARQGNMQQAEVLFRKAIDIDPSCGSGWLSLGMLLWGQGRQQEAWQAVKRSVILDPLNKEAVDIMRDMAERLG